MEQKGNCVLTYDWGGSFRTYLVGDSVLRGKFGIAPTPGSTKVLDRVTKQLVECDVVRCPTSDMYDGIGRVNRAPYMGFGGWSCAVNNYCQCPIKRRMAADFCYFASSRAGSIESIIPSNATVAPKGGGRDPYRRSQLADVQQFVDVGYEKETSQQYIDTLMEGLLSPNVVVDIRVPTTNEIYTVLDEEFHDYLLQVKNKTFVPDSAQRRAVADRINDRWEQIFLAYGAQKGSPVPLLESYQRLLGIYTPPENMNQINHLVPYGYTCFGFIALFTVLFATWTIKYRKSVVVRASQPFFLVLICCGALLFGSAIIPMGIDDSRYSNTACDRACMAGPWLLILGWTIIFSAIYAKLRRVNLVFSASIHMRHVTVSKKDVLIPFAFMLIVNVTCLLIWTILDPITWARIQMTGESYGRCVVKGDSMTWSICVGFLALINFSAVILANMEAYKAREISVDYGESKHIGIAMGSLLQTLLIGIPTLFLVISNPTASYFIRVSMIFIISMSTACLIFVPKINMWTKDLDERKDSSPTLTGLDCTGNQDDMTVSKNYSTWFSDAIICVLPLFLMNL
jgi:7 transmembrane sweet-taste receptor of 3 GCPR